MIRRDLHTDMDFSQPLHELDAARKELAPDPRVWHALLLPIKATQDPRFVVTGHNVSHSCELCDVAGDLRDGGVLVPWRAAYPDCTSTEEEAEEYYTCSDEVAGRVRMPLWVIESFHAAFAPQGHSGWRLDAARLEALDAWGASLPAVGASRLSGAYQMIDSLFAVDEAAPLLPPEVHLPRCEPPGEPPAEPAANPEPCATHTVLFYVDPGMTAVRVAFHGMRALCAEGYSLDVQQITWRCAGTAPATLPPPVFETLTTWHPLGRGHPAVPFAPVVGALLEERRVAFNPGELVIPSGDRLWGLVFHGGGTRLPEGTYTCTVAFVPQRAIAIE